MSESPVGTERPILVAREEALITVLLRGAIEDAQSVEWRRRLSEEIRIRGTPRFIAFDMAGAEMRSSMASRFEVASYVREMMGRIEWAALLLPRSIGSGVVVRLVMRLVGIANVSVCADDADFDRAMGEMRRGERPYR